VSKSDYPDYAPSRPRKHRITVGDATFIVTSNVDGHKRWIREVHHVRRHRSGSSADVRIFPNRGAKPSATLASLWAHLGIDPEARWKECAADHPAFPAKRSIRTAMDDFDDARKNAAAAAVLAAAGWTWMDDGAGHWVAPQPPAQEVDLGQFKDLIGFAAYHAINLPETDPRRDFIRQAGDLVQLIDSQAAAGEPNSTLNRLTGLPAAPEVGS